MRKDTTLRGHAHNFGRTYALGIFDTERHNHHCQSPSLDTLKSWPWVDMIENTTLGDLTN